MSNQYYLVEIKQGLVNPIESLTKNEFIQLREYVHELNKLNYPQRRVREILLNHNDWEKAFNNYRNEVRIKGETLEKVEFFDNVYIDLNRILGNFLSSFKTFVDHYEGHLKNIHGKKSTPWVDFKKFTESCFNKYFSYRFFYALRNYSHHIYFPINSVGIDSDLNKRTRKFEHQITIDFDKIKLLVHKHIFRHVVEDLEGYADLFPVEPLMVEILQVITELDEKVKEIETNRLLPIAEKVKKYIDKSETKIEVRFGKFITTSPKSGMWDLIDLPIEIVNEIIEH